MTNKEYLDKNFSIIFFADEFINSDQFIGWDDFKLKNDQVVLADQSLNEQLLNSTFYWMADYYLKKIGVSFVNDLIHPLYQVLINQFINNDPDKYFDLMIKKMNKIQDHYVKASEETKNIQLSKISKEIGLALLDFAESFQWDNSQQEEY